MCAAGGETGDLRGVFPPPPSPGTGRRREGWAGLCGGGGDPCSRTLPAGERDRLRTHAEPRRLPGAPRRRWEPRGAPLSVPGTGGGRGGGLLGSLGVAGPGRERGAGGGAGSPVGAAVCREQP